MPDTDPTPISLPDGVTASPTPAETAATGTPAPASAEVGTRAPEAAAPQADGEAPAASEVAPAAPAASPKRPEMSLADCAHELKTRFPALFAGPAKPIKLRVHADIQARAPGVFTKGALSAFFRRYTGGTGYLIALTRHTERFDLDGQPAGELSEEHRTLAAEELKRRRAITREREQQQGRPGPRATAEGAADGAPAEAGADGQPAAAGAPGESAPRPPRPPRGPRPEGDRPPRGPRPEGAGPRGPRPEGDRPPRGPRPEGQGPRGPRPEGDRPPRGPRPEGQGPRGPRPEGQGPRGPRPEGDRPRGPRADAAAQPTADATPLTPEQLAAREAEHAAREAQRAQQRAEREAQRSQQAAQVAGDQERQARLNLLREFERSPFTLDNFCKLKGLKPADIEPQLAQARKDLAAMPPPPPREPRRDEGRGDARGGDRRDGGGRDGHRGPRDAGFARRR